MLALALNITLSICIALDLDHIGLVTYPSGSSYQRAFTVACASLCAPSRCLRLCLVIGFHLTRSICCLEHHQYRISSSSCQERGEMPTIGSNGLYQSVITQGHSRLPDSKLTVPPLSRGEGMPAIGSYGPYVSAVTRSHSRPQEYKPPVYP